MRCSRTDWRVSVLKHSGGADECTSRPSGAFGVYCLESRFASKVPCSPGEPQVGPSPRLPARQLGGCARPSHWWAPVRRDLPRHSPHSAVHARAGGGCGVPRAADPLGTRSVRAPVPALLLKTGAARKPVGMPETDEQCEVTDGTGEACSHLRGGATGVELKVNRSDGVRREERQAEAAVVPAPVVSGGLCSAHPCPVGPCRCS